MKANLLLVLLLSISQTTFAAESYGIFMVVKGDVKVQSSKENINAKIGGKVFPGDSVVTGADSRAKIVMSDRNIINISPDSKIQITKYVNDPESGVKAVELKLEQGKVRNNVEQAYDGSKSKFIMKTPTAVAGVRGTQFVTSFDRQGMKTEITALRGQVAFASVSNGKTIGAPVIISKGQSASANAGSAATPPKTIPQNQMKEMDRDTSGMQPKAENKDGGNNQQGPGGKKGDKQPGDNPSGPNPGETRMVDNRDLNPNFAKDMAPPPMPAGFVPGGGPRGPLEPPPINPAIRDAIRNNIGAARLIIIPQ